LSLVTLLSSYPRASRACTHTQVSRIAWATTYADRRLESAVYAEEKAEGILLLSQIVIDTKTDTTQAGQYLACRLLEVSAAELSTLRKAWCVTTEVIARENEITQFNAVFQLVYWPCQILTQTTQRNLCQDAKGRHTHCGYVKVSTWVLGNRRHRD
jgi:hypothetical protein